MNIIQTFYDEMASSYDKLFLDWKAATREQAVILDRIFRQQGFEKTARVLDCACGIGTQAIGIASLGYCVTASDISDGELAQARKRAEENGVTVSFANADFCALGDTFSEKFDIVIAMDNALPHMLSKAAPEASRFECEYRATRREELTGLLLAAGCRDVVWK